MFSHALKRSSVLVSAVLATAAAGLLGAPAANAADSGGDYVALGDSYAATLASPHSTPGSACGRARTTATWSQPNSAVPATATRPAAPPRSPT
ncbi:hypothetical protein ACFQ1I_12540 [Kitasatospora arboriphila]